MGELTIRAYKAALFVTICALAEVAAAAAQSPGFGTVSGRVIAGGDRAPLKRARVTLEGTGSKFAVLTDETGSFAFKNVPSARYSVTASLAGYLAESSRNTVGVQVEDSQTVRDVLLELLPGAALSGVITDKSGIPVARAHVLLYRSPWQSGSKMQPVSTDSDDRGAYRMWGMPPGSYYVAASASPEGEAETFFPRSSTLATAVAIEVIAGSEQTNIDFPVTALEVARLSNHGVVSGVVLQDLGDPAAGARVEATVFDPAGVPVIAATALANDRGEYRLWGLPAGQYYVSAEPMIQGTVNGMGFSTSENGIRRRFAWVQTFYPGTESLNHAEAVRLSPNEEIAAVNFSLRLTPIATVRGTVSGSSGRPRGNIDVTLKEDASHPDRPFLMLNAKSEPSGRFQFPDLPIGQYTIEAVENGAELEYTSAPIGLTESLHADLVLSLQTVEKVSGGVAWGSGQSGTRPRAPAIAILARRVNPPLNGRVSRAIISGNGDFTLGGLFPGRYRIEVGNLPAGTSVRSIRLGGNELEGEMIEIPARDSLGRIQIELGETRP